MSKIFVILGPLYLDWQELCKDISLNHFLSVSLEAIVQRCSVKKVILEILQNIQENTCARVSFNKVAGLQLWWLVLYFVDVHKTFRGPPESYLNNLENDSPTNCSTHIDESTIFSFSKIWYLKCSLLNAIKHAILFLSF